MKSAVILDTHTVTDIQFQPASLDIWEAKYRLTTKDGTIVDGNIDDTYQRVARALADVEVESKRDHYFEEFVWALGYGQLRLNGLNAFMKCSSSSWSHPLVGAGRRH